jgi:nucleoside-diphosphate-sugar epimerase
MAVLITGGHGHLGSWAAHYLIEQGERVLLYDTRAQTPGHLENVRGQIEFIKGDVLDFARLADIFTRHKGEIDGIIHTVGIMGELVLADPHHNVVTNINGTHNILEAARIFDISKIVYTSTGAVYPPVPEIVAEDSYPPDPSDLYGATKLASELLGQHYGSTFGLDFRVGRVYFCYGPGKLPSTFVRLYQMAFGALEGLAGLKMERGADQSLDFTHIRDAARGVAMLYLADNVRHQVYNIATGQPTRLGTVVELAQKHSMFNVDVGMGSGVLMERAYALDITRARAELGFEPEIDIETGIEDYAAWIKEQLS